MKSLKNILILFILLRKPLFHLLHPHLPRVRNFTGKKTFRRCFIPAPQVFCLRLADVGMLGRHCVSPCVCAENKFLTFFTGYLHSWLKYSTSKVFIPFPLARTLQGGNEEPRLVKNWDKKATKIRG